MSDWEQTTDLSLDRLGLLRLGLTGRWDVSGEMTKLPPFPIRFSFSNTRDYDRGLLLLSDSQLPLPSALSRDSSCLSSRTVLPSDPTVTRPPQPPVFSHLLHQEEGVKDWASASKHPEPEGRSGFPG